MCSTKQHNKQFKTSCKSHYQNLCPNGWICVNLGELCSIFSTGPFGSMVHKSDYVEKDGVPLVNPINISNGIVSKKKLMMVSEEKATELHRYKLNRDDIVIARRGDLSKCAIITEIEEGWLCGTGSFFLHIPLVEPKYFELFYLSDYMQSKLDKECVGATMNNLNQGVLGNVLFMLPPHAEQKRILSEVQKWFSLIDTLKESREDLFQIIEKTKAKVLDLAIQGELALQNPSEEPAIELLKRINPNIKIPCDNPHYQKLPVGWSMCRLEDIVDYEQPQAYIVESTDYSDDYDIPVLTAGKTFIIGYTNEETGICDNLPVIIFDDFTTDSKYVEFPFKVKSSAMKILRVRRGIDIKYVAAFMAITRLIGKTHKRYWISEYSKIEIPIPPQKEQERIIMAIEQITARLNSITTML